MHHCLCMWAVIATLFFGHTHLHELHEKFSRFELISPRRVHIRVKRDAHGQTVTKTVVIPVFGRRLSLVLNNDRLEVEKIFSSDSTANAFYSNGSKFKFDIDPDDFYVGFIIGRTRAKVKAVHHEGLWLVQVDDDYLSFSVEPVDMYEGRASQHMMVAYRLRDIRTEQMTLGNGSFCRPLGESYGNLTDKKHTSITPNETYYENYNTHRYSLYKHSTHFNSNSKRSRRTKRSDDEEKMNSRHCDMLVIADFRFFSGVGGKSIHRTAKILIHVFQTANGIFNRTDFNVDYSVGIKISEMRVYSESGGTGIAGIINRESSHDAMRTLRHFSRMQYAKAYCLGHLSTQREFGDVIGLAVTANYLSQYRKGICGGDAKDPAATNVGLSTVLDSNKGVISIAMYTLVVTHEIGHNFGSKHDTEDSPSRCRPDEDEGGVFIMWPRTLSGASPNNKKFSPCSIKLISLVLKKRPDCLRVSGAKSYGECGDGKIDYWEDCDLGPLRLNDPTGCCKDNCEFTRGAKCSPYNHPCCDNTCQLATTNKTCTNDVERDCVETTHCDGKQFESCPDSRAKPNGQPCGDQGQCRVGHCLHFCSIYGESMNPPEWFIPCNCDGDRKSMCSICCEKLTLEKSDLERGCRPTNVSYKDGSHCKLGICKKGVCKESEYLDEFGTAAMAMKGRSDDETVLEDVITVVIFSIFTILCLVLMFIVGKKLFLKHQETEQPEDEQGEQAENS